MQKVKKKTALTKKSQITLPKIVRDALRVRPGDQVGFDILENDVRIIPYPSRLERYFGAVKPKKRPENFRRMRQEFEENVAEEVAKKH